MSQMFIANGTHQIIDFHYRIPENTKVLQRKIPVGGQIRLGDGLSQPAISGIIAQWEKYGMIDVKDIGKEKVLAPVCYSVDKGISYLKIAELVKSNKGVLVQRGKKTREDTATVLASDIGRQAREQGLPELETVEVGFEEVQDEGSRSATEDNPIVDETIIAARSDREQPKPQQQRGGKNRNQGRR